MLVQILNVYATSDITPFPYHAKHPFDGQSTAVWSHSPESTLSSQDGWTAALLAARFGHKGTVQELFETFRADFLHRKKVRAMPTVSGIEWLRELCMHNVKVFLRGRCGILVCTIAHIVCVIAALLTLCFWLALVTTKCHIHYFQSRFVNWHWSLMCL